MFFKSFIVLLTSILLSSSASPLQQRQYSLDCDSASSCAVYSGTRIWFQAQNGGSCPPITPPAAVGMAVATPTNHPESCFYPTSMDYCQLGQSAAMRTMSSIATAVYNAQKGGAVLCGATKTANLPIIAAASPVAVIPASEITVKAKV